MKFLSAAATALALACAGCYPDRMMYNYDSVFEMNNTSDDSAVLDESGRDEVARTNQIRRLEQLRDEEEPVYRLNAGDKVEVRVYGHDDVNVKTSIGPDGTIGIAFAGQVKLGGCTAAEGSELIRKGLEPYIKNPVVSVTIIEVHSETATIAGACAKPGVYEIANGTRLADIYALAGASGNRLFNGVEVDIADLDNSLIMRNGEFLPVDFHKAIEQGDPLHNIRIKKGDYIHIAQRMESSVTICGEVRNPHRRLYEPGMGLIETLTTAGWMIDSHWHSVIVIRDGLANPKMYKVDVDGILAGKCRNVPLKSGDIVYVPKDSISEYNVFVRKLLPTVQLFGLLTSRNSILLSN